MEKFVGKKNEVNFIFCFSCRNYKDENTCKAFPKGIPEEIFNGKKEHTEPIKGQTGDFVFERKS